MRAVTNRDIRMVLHGLVDPAIVMEARAAIVQALEQNVAGKTWLIALTPSITSGRWDLRVENSTRTALFSFSASPPLVPEFVRHYVSYCVGTHRP